MKLIILLTHFFAADANYPKKSQVFQREDSFCAAFLAEKERTDAIAFEPEPQGYEINVASGTIKRVHCIQAHVGYEEVPAKEKGVRP